MHFNRPHGSATDIIPQDILLIEGMNCLNLMKLLTWTGFKGGATRANLPWAPTKQK
jgi:hypothetical protein